MPLTHAAPARRAAASRRGHALHLVVHALSPTHGSRRNAAEALQALASTAPERRDAALRTAAAAHGSGHRAGPADCATAGQPR